MSGNIGKLEQSIFILTNAILFVIFTVNIADAEQQKSFTVKSPDNTIEVIFKVDQQISYSVKVDEKIILKASPISMTVGENQVLGENPRISDFRKKTVRQNIKPIIPEKFAVIEDYYNQLAIDFEGGYSVLFRAYNNGVAYRFKTNLSGVLKVISEQAVFNFAGTNHVYFPEEDSFFSHNERTYLYEKLDTLRVGRLASLPLLVATQGSKVLIAESDLWDYPGLWLKSTGKNALSGVFPHYPLESRLNPDSDRDMPVTKYADFSAKTKGKRYFPWRILIIAKEDRDLITNQLVYQLAGELQLKDTSWIKPGKVAWDWWNANNIYGVSFKSGVNTDTYKYYIDFASKFGIEYVILDEGWYKKGDLLSVVPEMDVPGLIEYGKKKNVGIILWTIWKTLDDQLGTALNQFEKWGAAGVKVDFMQRDDQEMVNYYWKIAKEAAKRKMLVDFHGAYKPSGLRRAYPNVISREGVKGLEHNKWSKDITPTHNLTLPFIRMVPGPMDYTPGAMNNAQPDNFRIVFTHPMSMTTRAHQVAMYVIYESPLQMMADSPSNYMRENECAAFIAGIPTTWEDTRVLEASVAEYLILARKNSDIWYIGAMTNEEARDFTVDLSFLNEGAYTAEIIQDGINADRYGSDYRKITRTISANDSVNIKLAPAGGWVMKLSPKK